MILECDDSCVRCDGPLATDCNLCEEGFGKVSSECIGKSLLNKLYVY